MLPGTIFMLLFIIIVIFGGSVYLVARNLKEEKNHLPEDGAAEDAQET